MREHKLYADLKKCIFAANQRLLHGCIVGKHGVRPDPEKIKAITDWPVPTDFKGLRTFLGPSGAFAQIFTQLRQDDCSSLSFIEKERGVKMECRMPALFQMYQAKLDTIASFGD